MAKNKIYKLYDLRNRLFFVTPVKANALEEISKIVGYEVLQMHHDQLLGGAVKTLIQIDK
jgi:hypothetical protein